MVEVKVPRGSNAPKQGQQGWQQSTPKPKEPKRRPDNNVTATLKLVTPSTLQKQNPHDMNAAYEKFENVQKVTPLTRKERLEKQVEDLADIKASLEKYSDEYKRSAVKDLMAQQKLVQVLNSVQEDEHFSQYSSSEVEVLLKEILVKEGVTKGNKILTSFSADTANITEYLESEGYIVSLNEIRDEAEKIVLERTVQEAEEYLQEISQKFPAAEKLLRNFKEDYNLNSYSEGYLFEEEGNELWWNRFKRPQRSLKTKPTQWHTHTNLHPSHPLITDFEQFVWK